MTTLWLWLRRTALMWLVLCTWSQMVDLDCAIHNPVHCQTLFESGDNTFARFDASQPLWVLVPPPLAQVPKATPFQGLCWPVEIGPGFGRCQPGGEVQSHWCRPPPFSLS